MNFVHWQAVVAPKGTPKESIDVVSAAIKKDSDNPEYKSTLAKIRVAPDYKTPEATAQNISDQNELYKKVTQEVMAAVKAQQN